MKRIPQQGLPRDQVLDALEALKADDIPWKAGRTFGYVYSAGEEAHRTCAEAFVRFLSENAIDPTVYPSLRKLENDVVGIAAGHLGGGPEAVGTFTSGGTESILLAMKAARGRRPDIARPQIVVPVTGHAAAHKAADWLGLEVVPVDVDEQFRAIPEAMAAAVTDRTILLYASAPSYAHGVVDPIPALGAIAQARDVCLHVDACVGGWLLPFWRELGEDVPPFDLSVPGVTSISMDLHKYAFAAKGASVVLYRDASYRLPQLWSCARWPGYTVVNPTVQSSRSGGPLAAAWAVLNHLGHDGYLAIARDLRDATQRLVEGVEALGLRVLAPPDLCMFAFTSEQADPFHIIDEMRLRGWYIQPQLSFAGSPTNVHISVNPGNVAWIEPFLADLADAVEAARQLPSGGMRAIASALAEQAAAGTLDLDALGLLDGSDLPERLAPINELLDALPRPLVEQLLCAYFDRLLVPAD